MLLQENFMNKTKETISKEIEGIIKETGICNKIIFDVGANIGLYSLFFASKNSNCIVYSFEPVIETYNIFLDNIKKNNLKNIRAYNFGFGAEKKKVLFGIPIEREKENIGLYTCCKNIELKNKVECQIEKMEEFIISSGIKEIDILKLDCEGSELDILFDIKNSFNKIKFIHIEINPFFKDADILYKFLKKNNWTLVKKTGKINYLWRNRLCQTGTN